MADTGGAPLAITMGDPAGIGGELTLRAWLARRGGAAAFLAIDDPDRLRALADLIGVSVPVREIARPPDAAAIFPDALPVLPVRLAATAEPGRPDPANAPAIVGSIRRTTGLAMEGAVGAIVTNPIHKAVLYAAGFPHPGHTEFLAELTGVPGREVMMLAAPALRVVPVTIHVSLRDALATLDTDRIVAVTRVTDAALRRDFAIKRPRLAIAGLNPHAGEEGKMGDEEDRLIRPAIEILRAEGLDVSGPWSPDTMFSARARERYDVAICMYHDQALIPLKTLDMDHGVNLTLGLPIIRASPDHGTAYDIAGRGIADPTSLLAAIDLAAELAGKRNGGHDVGAGG